MTGTPYQLKYYLDENGNAPFLGWLYSLRNIAEAEGGMAAVAEKAHLKRESLYRMLSTRGNPALSNLLSILLGMGQKMTIQPDKPLITS